MRAVLVTLVALIGCGQAANEAPGGDAAARADLRFVVVTHGSSADPFWSVVANGVRDAGEDMGVRVEYQSPNTFDMVAMTQLLDAATASRPDGIVVSIPDADALAGPIRAAVAAGIPVMSMNSGHDVYASLGALLHVGQPEYDAGYGAGERFVADGARSVLCVNHELGNVAQDRRCQGLEDALAGTRAAFSMLAVELADPEDTQQRVQGALTADPSIDAILTLGAIAVDPVLAALRDGGRLASVRLGTFDLSPTTLEAIVRREMLFAIDQQQYLQGYLPVVFMTKYLETGTLPGGGETIPTGPRFVTEESAERVLELTERGLR